MPLIDSNTERLFLVILISVAAVAGVLIFTVDERTSEALTDVEPIFVALFVAIWLFALVCDAGALALFTRGTGEKIQIFKAMRIATLRIFFNIITPFGFGGQPFSILSLTREGVPAGKASSIVIIKLVTLSAIIQIGAMVSFLLYQLQLESLRFVSTLFYIGGSVGIVFVGLLIAGFLYPRFLIGTFTAIGRLLHFFRLLDSTKILKRKIIHEALMARKSFRLYFSKHLGYFLSATALNGASYFTQLVLLYAILRGLGIVVPFGDALVLAAILLFLIMFMPTPGAIGFGEAFFLLLYANVIPSYMLGIALVLWRFFYHYLSSIFGAISSSQYIGGMIAGMSGKKKSARPTT